MTSLAKLLRGTPFLSYAYAYPHKTAYRRLTPPVALSEVWAGERREALFLYLHVPFCEVRCGFCNLFTTVNPEGDIVQKYLAAVRCEARHVRQGLPAGASFARLAIGGGTPTFLNIEELDALFAIAADEMSVDPRQAPTSIEVSPATVDEEKLALLRDYNVCRVSVGVQSFDTAETNALGRPQRPDDVVRCLQAIRDAGFPTLNIDLIYGAQGQSLVSWLASVRRALEYRPEELYLYPLYIRPLTGLGRSFRHWDDQRLAAYRAARDVLFDANYEQVSLRMFRRRGAPEDGGPVYCCQEDGMVGLGCGARSYTRDLHYSTEYAVGRSGVLAILREYLCRDGASFAFARHGFRLDAEDQRRRFIIVSLLNQQGLDRQRYARRFGGDPLEQLPELAELLDHHLADINDQSLRLTSAGIERSDIIGPWLNSRKVNALMETCELC